MLTRSALLIAGAAAALASAELAIRVFDLGPSFQVVYARIFQRSSDPGVDFELRPGAREGRGRISRAGLRDREFSEAKPPNVFRIAALGDSVTFGAGVQRSAAWPKQLEVLLEKARLPGAPRFEVMNFGVTGYGIEQIAAQLRTRALRFSPDLLVYGYVLNDPQEFSFEGAELERLSERRPDAGAAPLVRAMSRSRLFLWARHVWRERGESRNDAPTDPTYEAFRSEGRWDFFRALHQQGESAQRLDSSLAELGNASSDAQTPLLMAIFPILGISENRYPLRDLHDEIELKARSRGAYALDLQPAFATVKSSLGQTLSIDFLHPNALGYRVAAVSILAALEAEALLPRGSVSLDRIGGRIAPALGRASTDLTGKRSEVSD